MGSDKRSGEEHKLKELRERLERWASWRARANRAPTGGGGATVIGRLAGEMSEKRRKEARSGKRYRGRTKTVFACMIHGQGPKLDDDQEEFDTDLAIQAMPRELRYVIRSNYLDDRAQEAKADSMGVSYDKYKRLLTQAHYWLLGHLEAKKP